MHVPRLLSSSLLAHRQANALLLFSLVLAQHAVPVTSAIAAEEGPASRPETAMGSAEIAVAAGQSTDGAPSTHVEGAGGFAAALVATPPAVVRQLAESSGRRLDIITDLFNTSKTALSIAMAIGSPIQCLPSFCTAVTGLYAGLELTGLEISVDPDAFSAPGALLRVVLGSVDRAGAQAGYCQPNNANGARLAVVNEPWAGSGSPTSGSGTGILAASSSLTFKMGGVFRLCYSSDGTFTPPRADVVPPTLYIYGIYDERAVCATDLSCLTLREYRCYLLREAYNNMENSYNSSTSCIVQFDYPGAGFEGPAGMGSWSRAFGVEYDTDGVVAAVYPRACAAPGELPEDFLCNTGGSCGAGEPFMSMNITAPPSQGRFQLPAARNDLMGGLFFKAYTVAACYCPYFDMCDSYSPDYLQQVGILHYYVSKVCANGYQAVACTPDFNGAAPQHRFALRVECPTDACSAGGISRLKVVAQRAANDLPSWDPAAGCGVGVHGYNAAGKLVLPPDVNFMDMGSTNGGGRQDRKIWNFRSSSSGYVYDVATSGFLFKMGSTDHELRSSHAGETFDVCYCDDACDVSASWFKVGQMRFAPFQLVSGASTTSVSQEEYLVEYMNQPGTLGFYRPPIDYGVMGLDQNGMIKLVEDNHMSIDDAGCVAAEYDRFLIERENGLTVTTAPTLYRGRTNATMDPNKLIFNGGSVLNAITVKKAGFLAVCYCSAVNPEDGSCKLDHWVLAMRLTIRGPAPGQHWAFSTHVVFRFELEGWGLTKDDKIRIIPSTGDCSADNGDPNAAYTATNIRLDCPSPCSDVGGVTDVMNGDIAVSPLADDAYLCNEQNELCRTNYIKAVKVLDANTTELEFEAAPFLATGDSITMGDNIECHDEETADICNDERLSVLKGRYRLVDRDENQIGAPDEYIAGQTVTATEDNKKFTIPVGWPAPAPRFTIRYVDNRRGRWERHSKAITRQEIMGTRERADMKVCWKYAPAKRLLGPPAKYVAEAGTLTVMDPNPLEDCRVTLSSTVVNQRDPYAPLILSFRTASAETGRKYSMIQGTSRLRLFFEYTTDLSVTFADGATMDNNMGEDEVGEARQYICGKLFKELWSSDRDLGFPLPKGCYYRTYEQVQELNVLFDRKNGLSADQDYQLVMTGLAGQYAVNNGQYVQIFTMDDTDLKPYEAIERGLARLARPPQNPWHGEDGVKFLEPGGVKVIGGSGAGMLELKDGQALQMELKGDPAAGGIKQSSVLRIFLWPLTQWDVENTCIATCIPYHNVNHPCGAVQDCKGDSLIPNFQKNFLRIVLPSTMATMDQYISHTLVLPELKLPPGGFFPTRFALQVSEASDTKPHYIETVGDFLYKLPDEGQGVGKLVDYYGDGNHQPFRNDKLNVLYARIILPATLFSNIQPGDAVMTLTLPPGYRCVRPLDINGQSPWKAEEDLGVFGDQIPQGTGSPDEGSGARGWSVTANNCTYTLRQNAVIFAGSALTIRVTVDNPPYALPVTNTSNRWRVTLKSKGYHQWPVTFPPMIFTTSGANSSDSVAVLGRITDAVLTPTNFAVSTDANRVSMGRLQVFFRTEQYTGVFSSLQLAAPQGFAFLPQEACGAGDLEDNYYVTHKGLPTRRLPGIISCTHVLSPFNHALVGLMGAMRANTFYGFKMDNVQNPITYSPQQQSGWRIFTVGSTGVRVDGTPEPVPHVVMNSSLAGTATMNTSFGLYQKALNTMDVKRVEVSISEMLPFALTNERAVVTVYPLQITANATTTLRIVAPAGFVWNFTDDEFRYRVAGQNVTDMEVISGVTADLPGGIPMRDGNVLEWDVAEYKPAQVYGFQAFLHVPQYSRTASPNEFLVEFGHAAATLAGRVAASSVQAKYRAMPAPVRALVSARVDSTTSVQSKPNELIFQVQTITRIPVGGGLKIIGPPGFVIDSSCSLQPAPPERGSPYDVATPTRMLPDGVGCRALEVLDERVEVHIMAGAGAEIPPGRYRFRIAATNPPTVAPNPIDEASTCGRRHCWLFESVKYIQVAGSPFLDASISVPGFAVNRKLVEALIVPLTLDQQAATGRDDRPSAYNPLVFAFKMNQPALDLGVLRLRAPQGSIFREDCFEDIETRSFTVFGRDQALPAEFGEWPLDVSVLRCRGEGPDVEILIDAAGSTLGLRPEVLYPFRIALLHNPESPPSPNTWTMEYNGEAFDPFEGYDLWSFSRTSLLAVSTARSTRVTGALKLQNPVTFTFNPHNEVRGAGMKIKVTAPEGFSIAHTDFKCSVMVQPVTAWPTGLEQGNNTAPNPNFVGPASLLWGDADVDCDVDQATMRTLTATVLAESRVLLAGRDYQLTVRVHSPTIAALPPGSWLLETEASPALTGAIPAFRDASRIPGYEVGERVAQWMYRNEDPVTKLGFFNGVSEVPGLYFEMQFPNKLEMNDVVRVGAPTGFNFAGLGQPGSPAACGGFRWEPLQDAPFYLPNSLIQCEGPTMTFTVLEPKAIPELRLIKFRVDTMNPPTTPHLMENFWTVTHLGPESAYVRSSGAYESWDIVPQLYDVSILLVGPQKAEGSKSVITVSYMPVSDADQLQFTARLPAGFDFTGASASSVGHEVISTSVETVTLRASMYAGVQVDVVIENFLLGVVGGATEFDLVTKLNNGEKMDEALGFRGGFRLPGRVSVTRKLLTSKFSQDPVAYPVPSLWATRMGEPATAEFEFSLTVRAERGLMLRLLAPPYEVFQDGFRILKASDSMVVTAEVISASSGGIIARLGAELWEDTPYVVQANVTTPMLPNPQDAMWSIEVLDSGALPVNTNDALTEGFRVVDRVVLDMEVARSPPMAEVRAVVSVDPKSTQPTELILVAPPGFGFPPDCFVSGGANNEITACARAPEVAGRAAARLTCRQGGLTGPTEYVQILITTPAQSATEPSWFVDARSDTEQLGWGTDPVGVEVRQMLGAGVVYPGIPAVSGQMAFRFITNEKIEAGGKLVVGYPSSITINCDGAYLYKIALEGEIRCSNFPREGKFELTLSRRLPPGQQAFGVTSTCPFAVNEANVFYIKVLDHTGQVMDAAMNVPGGRIQHGLSVAALSLVWSNSEPNYAASISLGFELVQSLPPIEKDPPVMSELVVKVPRDFLQQVRRKNQIEVLNQPLPWRSGEWLDASDPTKLNFWLDESITPELAVGRYRFSFPVLVPSRMPKYNVFVLTICGPAVNTTNATAASPKCTGEEDPRAMVSFPLAGFAMGESHPSAEKYTVTGATWRRGAATSWWVALPWLMLFCSVA